MRALGALAFLHEDHTKTFSLTSMGALLCTDHPHSLRGVALWEEGPESYALCKHLSALITEAPQQGRVWIIERIVCHLIGVALEAIDHQCTIP